MSRGRTTSPREVASPTGATSQDGGASSADATSRAVATARDEDASSTVATSQDASDSADASRARLARLVADPGFTPGRADLAGVVELLADDARAADSERALLRAGAAAGPVLLRRLAEAGPPLRARVVRVLGRLGPDPAIDMSLETCLCDPDPKARRAAIAALGKRGGAGVAAALLARARVETSLPHLRSLVDALGKRGDARALTWLEGLVPAPDDPGGAPPRATPGDPPRPDPNPPDDLFALPTTLTGAPPPGPAAPPADLPAPPEALTGDPELRRLVARARLMLARSLGRGEVDSAIDLAAAASAPRPIVLTCRPGLEPLLAEELGATRDARVLGPGRVGATLRGPLQDLLAARLWTAVGLPLTPLPRGTDLVGDIVRLLTGAEARLLFETYTKGQVRYRIAWAAGGHRRALVWRVAAAAAAAWPELVNDPRGSTWEVVIDDGPELVRAELRPRRWTPRAPCASPPPDDASPLEDAPEPADPRFAYRTGDVPAASHPTIAAALARLAGIAARDVVWDPFVGSGLELCERGRLGPFAALHGTDLDPAALDVAAANLGAAGLRATLTRADATTHVVPGVTLVITNPPMGRRVHRGDVAPLLTAFVAHAARVLAPGGRLVWISPLPRVTDPAARAAGLVLRRALTLDMGGFSAQLQRWDRPFPTRPARGGPPRAPGRDRRR